MKISLLNDSFPPVIDGVANVVMNYASILHEMEGNRVVVATPRYPDANYYQYPYMVIPYQSFDTTEIIKGYRAGNPFAIRELQDLKEFNPDIIHSHCPVSSTILARLLRRETGAPIVFTYHTKFDVDIARAVKAQIIQKEAINVLVSNIEACDDVWVVSNGAGENLRSLGYTGEYHVMNNGVDFAKGRASDAEVIEATKDYDLPKDVPVFIFVGRIIKYKGLSMILDACEMLDEEGMDFRMVFVGSGPDAEELSQRGQKLGNKVIFTGPIYDREVLKAWNTRADLFLFPSVYDTNGLVVREAAACGLASVLIKDSCAAEGVTDGRNGYIIEENGRSMADLLLRVCKDMDAVHDVGMHAMDEIYISWDDSVHQAYERYGEVLELKAAGKLEDHRKLTARLEDYYGLFEPYSDSLTHFPFDIQNDIKGLSSGLYNGVKHISISSANMINEAIDSSTNMIGKTIEASTNVLEKTIETSSNVIGKTINTSTNKINEKVTNSANKFNDKIESFYKAYDKFISELAKSED